ncbi:hypothetical protein NIES4075_40870 [Tolypothrix sp. NIES-4075]|nr:hypothetical protein NIES4075_40870 [Tolypothrix sp. NIES-4075]
MQQALHIIKLDITHICYAEICQLKNTGQLSRAGICPEKSKLSTRLVVIALLWGQLFFDRDW